MKLKLHTMLICYLTHATKSCSSSGVKTPVHYLDMICALFSFLLILYLYYGSFIQVGDAALSILHSMVSAHSDLDDAGEIVTPTPRVKWILSSPRCLPHIAQVMSRDWLIRDGN